jgi:sugar diacid utilization regulator
MAKHSPRRRVDPPVGAEETTTDTPAVVELPSESIEALVTYLRGRADEIGELLAQRYRENIVEYRCLPAGFIEQDVAPTARENLEEILSGLTVDSDPLAQRDDLLAPRFDSFRNSAVRRFHQGVPVQALLHAYRLWGHTVWEQVQMAPQIRANPRIGLLVAGRIMRHVDLVSTAVAQAYFEEASGVIQDREVVRRDLLEALISGTADAGRMRRLSESFGLDTGARYCVVVVRQRQLSQSAPTTLREVLAPVREHLTPDEPGFLAGVRDEEIVTIYPLRPGRQHQDTLRRQANALAQALRPFFVGVSRGHTGLPGVAEAYGEAQDAIAATSVTDKPRAYFYSDALLDHIVKSSVFRDALYEDTILLLERHDAEHNSELLQTLRSYYRCGFNLSHTAKSLIVQPNTVRYRLKKVHEITGHDPFAPDDLVLLALALRVSPS